MLTKVNDQDSLIVCRAERIQNPDGTASNTYILLMKYRVRDSDGFYYTTELYNADTAEFSSMDAFYIYPVAYTNFKRLVVKYNGDRYDSRYGETRCNKQEALAEYLNKFCGDSCEIGRDITDFDEDYKGSYQNAYEFVQNQIKDAFEVSELIDLGVHLADVDIERIAARWFDTELGKYTSIAIKKSYQNGLHVFSISPDPKVSDIIEKAC